MTQMRPNPLRQIWQEERAATNGWLHIPSTWSAEIMTLAGWDSITIDMQHGLIDYAGALAMLTAISTTAVTPLVRVAWNEPGAIMKALDAGALGIICPMIDNRAQAEAFVGACRYAPYGYRSLGPTRAGRIYGDDYARRANDEVIALAMIETQAGLENLEAILSVPGLDGVYVGPGDLTLSLRGEGKMDNIDDEFLAILSRIVSAARAVGKVAGLFTLSPAYARQMRDLGFQLLTINSDTRLLGEAAKGTLNAFNGEAETAKNTLY